MKKRPRLSIARAESYSAILLNRIKKSLNENKTLQTIRMGEMELDVQHIDAIQQASNAVVLNSGKRRKITIIGHRDTMSRW